MRITRQEIGISMNFTKLEITLCEFFRKNISFYFISALNFVIMYS
jgi:hypothetical protein